MKAVILAGGLGTRISEESHLKPKPMIEVGGKPIIWHIMKCYSAHGIDDFVVCLGYKGYVIKEYFANYFLHMSDVTIDMANNKMEVHQKGAEPWRVTLVDTGEETQTGGRLKRVARYLGDEDFCFTYGDGVADVDIRGLIAFHKSRKVQATLTAVQPPGRFGALVLEDKLVTSFQEKPKGDGGWINGGFFVLSPRVLDHIEGDHTVWEREPLERLARERMLAAWFHRGFWQPMDTLRDKNHLEELGGRVAALEDLVISRDFWSGKRVLVTGHTGFKGSWLALWLDALGAEVAGYALEPPTEPSLWGERVSERMRDERADVRELERVARSFAQFRPEIVFHLAAQSLVRPSYADPVATYATNVLGTVHVLEAARRTGGVRVIVNVTSDKCYENREWDRGYREDDAMGGRDPYSSSKGCAELVTAAWRSSFFAADGAQAEGTALASARAGNVIGGGDWARDRLVPDLVRAALEGAKARIRNPNATRPWQHVLDPLHGYLTLAERLWREPGLAGGWNFGPAEDDAVPVGRLADEVVSRWGKGAGWTADPGPHPHEARWLKLDCSKARSQLGWTPRLRLPAALDWTVEWYRAQAGGADVRALSLDQIRRFQARA